MKRRITAEQKLEIANAVVRGRALFKSIDAEHKAICHVLSCSGEEPADPRVKPRQAQLSIDDRIDDCIEDHGDVDELLAELGVSVE